MKKSFLFVSIIALVGLFAASCQPKIPAPTVRFDAEIDVLTVQFVNMCKEADSYAWEFGDGATDTAANPVHVYAEFGTYTVKLTATNAGGSKTFTDEISLVKPLIVLDSKFEDWAAVPAADLAEASTNADAKWLGLSDMKWCADADFVYFYLEFKQEAIRYFDEEEGIEKDGWAIHHLDLYLNVDGDETTGSNSYLWDNSAADYLIEGTWEDNMESAGVYFFPADAAQDAWAWESAGVVGSTSCSNPVKLENGNTALEGRIIKALIPSPFAGLKVGVFTSNSAWSESGVLPQTTINDDGTSTPLPLLEVKLP